MLDATNSRCQHSFPFASHRSITTMRMTLAVVVLMLLEEDSRIGIDLKGDNTITEVVQRD